MVIHYTSLASKLEEVEAYGRESRRKLETMGLLGVVAGFMTHEAARILDGLDRALSRLRALSRRDAALASAIRDVESGYATFRAHVEYTSLFVDSMHRQHTEPFSAKAQVDRILETFGSFTDARVVQSQNEIAADVRVLGVPVATYSGVVLNLYTNAIKAVLAREHDSEPPQIVIRGWNETGCHIVEVADKGVGIPPSLLQRVFDPLFTTTSSLNNPLGSGMGLGLSLIKEVMAQIGGKVRIVDAPATFSTCFRVEFQVPR